MRKRKATKLPPLKDPSEIPDDELDAAFDAFWQRAKSWPDAKRHAAYAKWQAAFERRRTNDLRVTCNGLRFWLFCPHKSCRRNESCSGDANACNDRFWPHVPERHKFFYRGMIVAMSGGLSYEEAVRKVRADAERNADKIARIEAEQRAHIRALAAAERAKGAAIITPAMQPVHAAEPTPPEREGPQPP
jgi:hypothetical protein